MGYPATVPTTSPLPSAALEEADTDLVARSQHGDTHAFDTLIHRYANRLYAHIYHMTGHKEDAHDLLQDVFAKAWRSLALFRGQSQFYTWVYSISTNMTLNFLKKRNRRQGKHAMSLDDIDSGVERDDEFVALTGGSSPDRDAHLHELQKHLHGALQRLSTDHRAVVVMFDIQGLPHAEISQRLQLSEGTVRSRLHYAHKQLQSLLEEFWKNRSAH
jgi:RNA polymerase sigma factor (sigma-70 family)